jgi:UDP-3-O-[3-hydroxymyristoyl] glucosamine N-acyltransferase
MNLTISRIAELTSAIITGEPASTISRLAKIEEALPGDLTFLSSASYQKYFTATKATAVFVKTGFAKTRTDIIYLEVADPNKAFLTVLVTFFSPQFTIAGVAKTASIAPDVQIGEGTTIGEHVVIEEGCTIGAHCRIYHNTVIMKNSTLGDNCLVFPNVTIREETVIGNRVILHAGVVLGADGFGYAPNEKGEYFKIPQIGNVVLEDDVEIGANTTIDRAALGSTIVKKGTKIDNLVQIAHNVSVGSHTVISSQTGIAGSSKIGNHCVIAGQVGITGHIEIGDKVMLGAQSGISKSITEPGGYFGYPAKELKTALKLEAHVRSLPDYVKRITELEKKLAELTTKQEKAE